MALPQQVLSCPMFGSCLVNGSFNGERQRLAVWRALWLPSWTRKSRFVSCHQPLFIVVTLSSPFQTKSGIDLKTQTLKDAHKWVLLHAILQGSLVFRKFEGLLAKVQADWEDRGYFLPSKPLPRTLFLLNDDVSARNLVLLQFFSLETSPSSFRAFPASFR